MKRLVVLASVLAVALALGGCASFVKEAPCDRGAYVYEKEVSVWPLFSAEKEVYEKGVHEDGNVLFFISWSKWTDKPYAGKVRTDEPVAVRLDVSPAAAPAAGLEEPAEQ